MVEWELALMAMGSLGTLLWVGNRFKLGILGKLLPKAHSEYLAALEDDRVDIVIHGHEMMVTPKEGFGFPPLELQTHEVQPVSELPFLTRLMGLSVYASSNQALCWLSQELVEGLQRFERAHLTPDYLLLVCSSVEPDTELAFQLAHHLVRGNPAEVAFENLRAGGPVAKRNLELINEHFSEDKERYFLGAMSRMSPSQRRLYAIGLHLDPEEMALAFWEEHHGTEALTDLLREFGGSAAVRATVMHFLRDPDLTEAHLDLMVHYFDTWGDARGFQILLRRLQQWGAHRHYGKLVTHLNKMALPEAQHFLVGRLNDPTSDAYLEEVLKGLSQNGNLEAVEPLLLFARRGHLRLQAEQAVMAIQQRLGGQVGSLSLMEVPEGAGQDAGGLSLTQDEAGNLSLANGEQDAPHPSR